MAKKSPKDRDKDFQYLAVLVSRNCTTLANKDWAPQTFNVDLWATPWEAARELRRIADWLERL